MIDYGESYFGPHLMAEILENMIVKLFGIIDNYLSGHSEAAYYVLPKKSFELRCSNID
jgi:hypothetical protein